MVHHWIVNGFIASVEKPSNLKIRTTDEKVGIDLFVNGRLREKNILNHFSDFSTRVVASYLYGQIHFDRLDNGTGDDRFTSSREGVKEGDVEYERLLAELKNILVKISEKWDEWRIVHKEDGDIENTRITPKERKARSLVNEVSNEFTLSSETISKSEVDKWINNLRDDAQFNVSAYIDCFMSENLIRKHIGNTPVQLSSEAKENITKFRKREQDSKAAGSVSIDIRVPDRSLNLSYLDMDELANLVDKGNTANLSVYAKRYKPMRDAMAHTARLTENAKRELTSVYENIKSRLKTLLSEKSK